MICSYVAEEKVFNDIVQAERELDDMVTSKKKKKKNKEEESKQTFNKYDALQARLKLRRGLLGLFMLMKVRLK